MIYILIAIVVIFYMLPWLILHGWVLYNVIKGGDPNDETFNGTMAAILIIGVIPFVNAATFWVMFIDRR